jgi:hypothetical protein
VNQPMAMLQKESFAQASDLSKFEAHVCPPTTALVIWLRVSISRIHWISIN